MNLEQAWALVEQVAQAWEMGDLDAITAPFAPDGVLISPGGSWQGHLAIRKAAEEFFQSVGDVHIEVTRVLIDGDQGAAEWTWSETRLADGSHYTAEDAIIFALREGQIIYWREYFDTAGF